MKDFTKIDPEEAVELFMPFNGRVDIGRISRIITLLPIVTRLTALALNSDLNTIYNRCINEKLSTRQVYQPLPEHVEGELDMGELLQGGDEYGPAMVPISDLPHCLALGANGMGKSTFNWHLMKQLIDRGMQVLYVDRKQDIRHLTRELKMNIVRANDCRFQIFESPCPEIDQSVWISKVCDLFKIWLMEAGINYIKEQLVTIYEDTKKVPTFYDLYAKMRNTTERGDTRTNYHAASFNKIRGLAEELGDCFGCSKGYSIVDMLDDFPLCIEVDSLNSQSERFLISYLLLVLYEYRKAKAIRGDPGLDRESIAVFISEAAAIFNSEQQRSQHTAEVGYDLLQEIPLKCRDMKMCLFLDSQVPLITNVMNNIRTKAVFYLPDASVAKNMAQSMGLDPKLFTMLKRGEAVIKTEKAKPYVIRTRPLERRIITNEEYLRLSGPYAEHILKNSVSLADELEQNEKKTLSPQARMMLMDVCRYPDFTVSSRYKKLKINGSKQQDVIAELESRNYAKVVPLNLDGRAYKFLVVLAQGVDWLRSNGYDVYPISFQGNESEEHLLVQVLVSAYLRKQGKKVFHDYAVGTKVVDVYAEGRAFEVAMNPEIDVARLKTALPKLESVHFLCRDVEIMNKLKQRVEPVNDGKITYHIAGKYLSELRKSTLDSMMQNEEEELETPENSPNGQDKPNLSRTGGTP